MMNGIIKETIVLIYVQRRICYPSMISVEISMILDRVFLPHMYQILENLAKDKYLKQLPKKFRFIDSPISTTLLSIISKI